MRRAKKKSPICQEQLQRLITDNPLISRGDVLKLLSVHDNSIKGIKTDEQRLCVARRIADRAGWLFTKTDGRDVYYCTVDYAIENDIPSKVTKRTVFSTAELDDIKIVKSVSFVNDLWRPTAVH